LAGFQPAKPNGKKGETGCGAGLTLGVPRQARLPKAGMRLPFQGVRSGQNHLSGSTRLVYCTARVFGCYMFGGPKLAQP